MTNEQLAAFIKQGGNDELLPILWENVQKLMYMKADKAYKAYTERFKQCGVELWDVRQSCYMAFLQAVKGYDSSKGYKFTAYLSYPFKTTISELLGNRGNCKKNPLDNCESLQQIIGGEDDDLLLIDTIKDDTAVDVQRVLDLESDGEVIRKEVAKLSPIQRQVVEMHYFDNVEFTKIAEHFGLSYSRILQIRNDAFKKLRRSDTMQRLWNEIGREYHSKGFVRPDEYYLKEEIFSTLKIMLYKPV